MTKNSGISHRRHNIKSIRTASGYQARAFRGDNAVGDIFTAVTQDAAVLAVKNFLDERAAALRAHRDASGFPCADEIRAAFPQVSMNKAQEAMLLAHLSAPNHILTATELAQAAGYEDYAVANRQYGQLAHDLAHELDWTPEEQTNGVTTWTFTLADDADKQARKDGVEVTGQWRWKLRPEVIEALS